jgi:drug/metabolite transporter (DMT)-like permease
MVVVSAVGFATLPLFGKLAYASGVEPFALLAWRFTFSALLLGLGAAVVARRRGEPVLPPSSLTLRLLVVGAVVLTPEVVLYFLGLQRVSAGLAETLLFLYPAWVVVLMAVIFGQRPTAVMVGCVVAAIVGAALTIGGAGTGEPVGVLMLVAASVGYAGYVVAASRWVTRAGTVRGTFVVMSAAAACFVVLALATRSAGPQTLGGWVGVLGMTVFGTVLSFGLLAAGLGRIGAAEAGVISTVEPVITVALGAWLLAEQVGALQVVGMVVILASVAVLLVVEARAGVAAPEGVPAPGGPDAGGNQPG